MAVGVPSRPSASRRIRCNNVADKVEKQADELASQVVVSGLGGLRSWGRKTFGDRAELAAGGAAVPRWWGADIGSTRFGGYTYLTPTTTGIKERVNPGCGRNNCGPVAFATDRLLGGKLPPPADPAKRPLTGEQLQELAGNASGFEKSNGLANVVKQLLEWGNGARVIVMGQPSPEKQRQNVPGHFFNVINDNGVIVFIDGQTGKAKPDGWDQYYLMRTGWNRCMAAT
ncbi:toxin glutamine deamidase domain-containing protein [Kitasatospora purpeofusca]|uniref:toxin glutamine deamidase domain-containing protein n=1 Tax=Kitasatospora purpeofusca TaxID=67352 RepID=UPI003F4AAD64